MKFIVLALAAVSAALDAADKTAQDTAVKAAAVCSAVAPAVACTALQCCGWATKATKTAVAKCETKAAATSKVITTKAVVKVDKVDAVAASASGATPVVKKVDAVAAVAAVAEVSHTANFICNPAAAMQLGAGVLTLIASAYNMA